MSNLILGLIGGSEGNGHPFSWSAIFNGYDKEEMLSSEYPVISRYLAQEKWPAARIRNATVDFVYTPSMSLSEKISKASKIKNVVSDFNEMLGNIDGLLLARDDAENHLIYAKIFLETGIPIFIDKPIALNSFALKKLWALQKYETQIFSCSSLSHAPELLPKSQHLKEIGKIYEIVAKTPKTWNKYAIHIIEPLINYLNHVEIHKNDWQKDIDSEIVSLQLVNSEDVHISLYALGQSSSEPISFYFKGEKGEIKVIPQNTFSYFKKSLKRFIDNIGRRKKIWESSLEHHEKVVSIIEMKS